MLIVSTTVSATWSLSNHRKKKRFNAYSLDYNVSTMVFIRSHTTRMKTYSLDYRVCNMVFIHSGTYSLDFSVHMPYTYGLYPFTDNQVESS